MVGQCGRVDTGEWVGESQSVGIPPSASIEVNLPQGPLQYCKDQFVRSITMKIFVATAFLKKEKRRIKMENEVLYFFFTK